MLDRSAILRLIPHQGTMCLLENVLSWSQDVILCQSCSHLAPDNPLRRARRLHAVAGIEYGLQAAALHGALRGEEPQPAGWLASLRAVNLYAPHLDDPAIARLLVEARIAYGDRAGMIYDFALRDEAGRCLLDGRATLALRRHEV